MPQNRDAERKRLRKYRRVGAGVVLSCMLLSGCSSAAPSKAEAQKAEFIQPSPTITPSATLSLYERMEAEDFADKISGVWASLDRIKEEEQATAYLETKATAQRIQQELELYWDQMDQEYRTGKIPFVEYREEKGQIEEYQRQIETIQAEISERLPEE